MPIVITKEDAKKLGLRPIGKKHPVRVALETMPVGELQYITRADFRWKKKAPYYMILQIQRKTSKKFTIFETLSRLGWIVERVE